MKIGIAGSTDVRATVERCRHLGVEAVFLPCAFLPGYREQGYPDLDALRAIKRALEAEGIAVPSACTWFAKWPVQESDWRSGRSTDPAIVLRKDRRCMDAMVRTIEVLGESEIVSVLHYVDIGKPDGDVEACWEALIEMYRELIPAAEQYGVGIGNHSLHRLLPDDLRENAVAKGVRLDDYGVYTTEGWGGPFLVDTPDALGRLVDAVPSPCNGVTMCTGMDIVGGEVKDLVEKFAGKIHFCQLRDHTDRWPGGVEVLSGEGRVDLRGVIEALGETDYTGILHPEHLGKSADEDEDRLAKAVDYVRGVMDELDSE
ncbi:MAG: TIM barrel protein [bacterium]|nr:TIM barrel protein [bacterium]